MKHVKLPSGETVAALGLGTWKMPDGAATRAEEIATIRLALDLGVTLIDTAEMYGEGKAEELIGEAIAGRRGEAFIVSKVYPHNASRQGAIEACERSLKRLGTDRIDLYLLHWRGSIPFTETLEGFMALQRAGKIRHYGVSNINKSEMQELWQLPGGSAVATDQLYYNLARRGLEWDLLPWCRQHGVPIMAYSPIDEGRLAHDKKLAALARPLGMTAAQLALAWLLRNDDVIAIPKTGRRERLRENLGAFEYKLDQSTLAAIDRLFPPPAKAQPLEMT